MPIHHRDCRQVIPDQYIDQRKLEDLLEILFPTTDEKPKYATQVRSAWLLFVQTHILIRSKWRLGRWVIKAPEKLSQDQILELKL